MNYKSQKMNNNTLHPSVIYLQIYQKYIFFWCIQERFSWQNATLVSANMNDIIEDSKLRSLQAPVKAQSAGGNV